MVVGSSILEKKAEPDRNGNAEPQRHPHVHLLIKDQSVLQQQFGFMLVSDKFK